MKIHIKKIQSGSYKSGELLGNSVNPPPLLYRVLFVYFLPQEYTGRYTHLKWISYRKNIVCLGEDSGGWGSLWSKL